MFYYYNFTGFSLFLTKKSKSTNKNIIILDSILGISAKGNLRGHISNKIEFINKKFNKKENIKIYSLDIPTGFDPNNGKMLWLTRKN